ncbi:MAG: hypothetical protein V2A66_04635 [Pseudomonadota bacterium]
MKKILNLGCSFAFLVLSFTLSSCGSSSSSSSNTDALDYAKFGQTVDSAIPAGLKAGGANADIAAIITKTLSGTCASPNFESCPYITTSGGGDENSGEILMRLWSLDYHSDCTDALITAGTCFECKDCGTGYNNRFVKPTMISSPTSCALANTATAYYVNLGVDPCFFDTIIGNISNIPACKTVAGGTVNISTAVPWYASWGIPQTISFSSYYKDSNSRNIWWTVNDGAAGSAQYFFSLDSNWLHVGLKDTSADKFLFLGTGSPAYYQAEATAGGYTTGVNISAYAGTISAIPAQFEAIQVRVQDPNKYIERMKSNGSYLWYQGWSKSAGTFPETASDVDTYKNNPSTNRCVQIGSSVVLSKYVPLDSCVTSFGKASTTELNQDSNYTLKIIDGTTVSAVSFTTSLTPTVTESSCLPATQ